MRIHGVTELRPARPAEPTYSPPPLARVEAALFLAREPLSSRKLAQLANLADGTQARTLIGRLREKYDARSSGFQVEEVAGGYQLLTRPEFGKWLRRVQASPVEVRLSMPALETVVVVAYRQPVLRAEIEAVRGVQCGEILRQLLERDLVRIVGRSSELGRPFLYGTTRRFMQVFGLRRLDELPWTEQLRNSGIPSKTAVENGANGSHDRRSDEPTVHQIEEESPVIDTDRFAETLDLAKNNDAGAPIVSELDDDEIVEDGDDEFEDVDDEDDEDDEYEYEYEYVDEDDDGGEEDEEDDEYEYEYVEDDEGDEEEDEDEGDEWEEAEEDEDDEAWDDDEWEDEELDDEELDDEELDDEELDELDDDELDDDELDDG